VILRINARIFDFTLIRNLPLEIRQYGFIRIIFVIFASLIYRFAVFNQKIENQKNQVLLEKTETELQFLKNQINPHFFFNTLNNIYGLSYNARPQAPEAILKLSNAMRYIIYETQSDQVPLSKELDFINNYLELERLRLVHTKNIHLNAQISPSTYKIAPLILLPFIENCFKHGDIVTNPEGIVEINIWIENERLYFSCVNSFDKTVQKPIGGIGNNNVTKRLELIYKDNYKLESQVENKQYYVFLELPLNR
jgi:LytS/YehU family sensor histidine kinase